MQSFLSFLAKEKDSVVLEAHAAAFEFCEKMDIPMERRIRRKKRLPWKETTDIGLTMQQEMRMEHLEVMDRLTGAAFFSFAPSEILGYYAAAYGNLFYFITNNIF